MSTRPANTVLQRHFVTVRGQFGTRQVHYRRGGQGPVVLLLHQSPQSSREMEPLIEAWGGTFTLIAPDSPGYGFSQPLQRAGQPVATATIDDFAAATLEFADALGVGRFGVYGFHTGASIGVAMAHRFPERVAAVAANGFLVLTAEERAAMLRDYLPPLIPRWDGGHLTWLWARLREQIIFFPWHDRRAATRMIFPMPAAARLQQGVDEFLAAGSHYHVAYAAAFSDQSELRLPSLRVPLLITAAAPDPLAGHLARVAARSAFVQIRASTGSQSALEQAIGHLGGHPGDMGPGARAGERAGSEARGPGQSEYRGTPGRQIRVIHTAARGAASGQTVVLLHAPGSSAESLGSMAGKLAEYADVLAPDLPGHGASDPLPVAEGGSALTGTVAQLLAALAPSQTASAATTATTVMAIGSSAPVAIALATELGRHSRVVLIEPPAWSAADANEWLQHGLPAITPVWSGGHLLEAWHLIRDSRLFSPWFRREPAGIQPGEPELDNDLIHRDVRDLLRSNGAWQALLRATLSDRDAGGRPHGLTVVELRNAPANWADLLNPGRAGTLPSS